MNSERKFHMLRKQLAAVGILVMTLSIVPQAPGLNYSNNLGNQSTFETLEEARVNGPVAVATIEGNKSRTYKSHPALEYLKGMGLISIIDQAKGSVILVTPADPKAGFGAADQKNYYALQTAMFTQKGSVTLNKVTTSFSDGEYFGGFGYTYLVGIDG